MKSRALRLLFALYSLVVIFLIGINAYVLKNPGGLSPESEFPSWMVLDRQHETGFQTTYTYLGNAQRTQNPLPSISLPLSPAWRVEGLNIGVHSASKSSPAVDDSGVYVGSDTGWINAYSHDGKLKWRFLSGRNKQGIHGSALLDEQRAYIGSYNGRLYALDKRDGSLVWSTKIADAIGSSPTKIGEDLIVSAETESRPDGLVVRINGRTGQVKWRSPWLGQQVHSSPTISTDQKLVFLGANNGFYHAFDSRTGELQWRIDLGGAVKGTGVADGDTIYVSSWGDHLFAIVAKTGEIRWKAKLESRSQSSPLVLKDVVVVHSHIKGHLYGFDKITGRRIWSIDMKSRFGMSSPVGADLGGKAVVLALCKDKTLCVIEPSRGKILTEYALPTNFTSVPSIWQKKIFLSFDQGPLLVLQPTR